MTVGQPRVVWDVVVVGAGPVGLMAGNLSARLGLRTLVVDKTAAGTSVSRAIGIMTPSLQLFERLGIRQAAIDAGVLVTTAYVHGRRKTLGCVRFDGKRGAQTEVLSLPQDRTEALLRRALLTQPGVGFETGTLVRDIRQSERGVAVTLVGAGGTEVVESRFVLACDGDKGELRERLGLFSVEKRCKQTFLMGDFEDDGLFGNDAHLFFTPLGAVESFPLPDGLRRWIVETEAFARAPTPLQITTAVEGRTGIRLSPGKNRWLSPFGVKQRVIRPFFDHRTVFLGDAAHVMPPIGGQGMNTGFADAFLATRIIAKVLREQLPHEPLFAVYDRYRARAVHSATRRAVISMGIGTLKGRVLSAFRNALIHLALNSPLRRYIPPHFAMLTIPYGTPRQMEALLDRQPKLQKS